MFDLEKRLMIISPCTPPTFLFLLEHIPADPCPSGNHEGRTITDITLSFHHFLTWDLSSSTDWANTPTRILVLLREHRWGDSNSRIIVFPQQHLTHQGEITCSHTLSLGVTESLDHLLGSLPEGRLTTSQGLENVLSVEGLFICWENKLSSWKPTLSPGVVVWRTLVLHGDLFFSWPISPGVQIVSSAQKLRAKMCLCSGGGVSNCSYFTFSR